MFIYKFITQKYVFRFSGLAGQSASSRSNDVQDVEELFLTISENLAFDILTTAQQTFLTKLALNLICTLLIKTISKSMERINSTIELPRRINRFGGSVSHRFLGLSTCAKRLEPFYRHRRWEEAKG